jgi:Ca-activated chloride channel family protein
MMPALAAALEAPAGYRSPGARSVKQVIFLTDGAVGNEAELFAFIASHLGETRLFTVGIGAAPNAWFMQRAAEEGRGTYTFIGDPSEVAFKVERLAAKLAGPVVTDLEVVWEDPGAEVWPQRLGDLYAGEPLVVAARTLYPGDAVEIRGRRDGAFWSDTVPLVRATDAGGGGLQFNSGPGVRQLWAQRKIAGLMASVASGADPAEVRKAVVEVALAHHLVSQYTSLVAVDVTPSRPAGEGLGTRRQPLATPAGWVPPGALPMGATAWPAHLLSGLVVLALALLLLVGSTPRRRLAPVHDEPAAGVRS